MNGEELKLLHFVHLDREIKANLVEAKINNDEIEIFHWPKIFDIVEFSVKKLDALEVIPTLGRWAQRVGPKAKHKPRNWWILGYLSKLSGSEA